jgi:hypothetical protein
MNYVCGDVSAEMEKGRVKSPNANQCRRCKGRHLPQCACVKDTCPVIRKQMIKLGYD